MPILMRNLSSFEAVDQGLGKFTLPLAAIYNSAPFVQKQRLLSVVFPEGFTIDKPNLAIRRTAKINMAIFVIADPQRLSKVLLLEGRVGGDKIDDPKKGAKNTTSNQLVLQVVSN